MHYDIYAMSSDAFRDVRLYNSLASKTYNQKTIDLLNSDPYCQIVIATKALSLGIHAEELRDSITVGTADTQDNGKQDGGHAGRKEGIIAHLHNYDRA